MSKLLPLVLALLLAACGVEVSSAPGHGSTAYAADNLEVPAACGKCIYKLQGLDTCELAVDFGGHPHRVSGSDFDIMAAGGCAKEQKLLVSGELVGETFVATSVALAE